MTICIVCPLSFIITIDRLGKWLHPGNLSQRSDQGANRESGNREAAPKLQWTRSDGDAGPVAPHRPSGGGDVAPAFSRRRRGIANLAVAMRQQRCDVGNLAVVMGWWGCGLGNPVSAMARQRCGISSLTMSLLMTCDLTKSVDANFGVSPTLMVSIRVPMAPDMCVCIEECHVVGIQ
jgi:hypothetical protein